MQAYNYKYLVELACEKANSGAHHTFVTLMREAIRHANEAGDKESARDFKEQIQGVLNGKECPNCRSEIVYGAIRCPICGTKL